MQQLSGKIRRAPARAAREAAALQLRLLAWRNPLESVSLSSLVPGNLAVEPPILDDICMPPYFGSTTHDDFTPLMALARSLKPRVIVELGTAHGNTVANLCRQNPGCRIVTVNAPAQLQTGQMVTFALGADDIGRVYRRYGYVERVTQLLANTLELDLAPYLEGNTVDLAIVDACHDTPYVINDFQKVQPFIRPGGVVLLHDTYPDYSSHLAGSYRACLLLKQRGFDIKHVRDTWWGIWTHERPAPQI